MKALITHKLGMTSVIDEKGAVSAITLLSATPNTVTQAKTTEKDGYNAIQLGAGKAKKLGKSLAGHLKPSNNQVTFMREFRITGDQDQDLPNVGSQLEADVFEIGDTVQVTGISKGKGFGGVIKRHGFHRGRKTHGAGSYRRPGSIGSMYPQHILPGKKMAGHMGHRQVSTKNLTVALVDKDLGVIGVKGSVPGPKKSLVLIKGVSK